MSIMIPHSFGREVASVFLRAFVVVISLVLILAIAGTWAEDLLVSDGSCNIAVLPIDGVIAPYGEFIEGDVITTPSWVRSYLAQIEDDHKSS